MTWSQRLKRVFHIEVERCRVCGAKARVIAAIGNKAIIDKVTRSYGGQGVQCTNSALAAGACTASGRLFSLIRRFHSTGGPHSDMLSWRGRLAVCLSNALVSQCTTLMTHDAACRHKSDEDSGSCYAKLGACHPLDCLRTTRTRNCLTKFHYLF